MSIVPPSATTVQIPTTIAQYRKTSDITPFTNRSGMTYQALLEELRQYVVDLAGITEENFDEFEETWETNVNAVIAAVNTSLTTQQQQFTATLATLDDKYGTSGDFIVVNRLPGIKLDGSADMTTIINTALAAVPVGTYTNLVVLPNKGAATVLRIDGTLVIDLARCGFVAPYGGVKIDASRNPGSAGGSNPSILVRASAAVNNNTGYDGPRIGPFKLTGPGSAVVGSVGILYSESASNNTQGRVRNTITTTVTVENFETCIQFGDNAFNLTFENVVLKGWSKAGIWFPSTTTNSGERLSFLNSVIQEGYGANSAAILNEGTASIFYSHGSIDYVSGYFLNNASSGRIECMFTHFERSITTSTNAWMRLAGGLILLYGGIITATGTYDASTAPTALVQNSASATYADGVVLIDGVMFGNSFQTSSGNLISGTGNSIVQNTTRQNQFQQAFKLASSVTNLFCDQNAAVLQDKWFMAFDTGTIANTARTSTGVAGNNGSIALQSSVIRTNPYAVLLSKVGGASTAFGPAVCTPIARNQCVGGRVFIARTTAAVAGYFNLQWMFAQVVDDGSAGPRIARSLTISSTRVTPTTDLTTQGAFYSYETPSQVQRAPGWATHIVLVAEMYNYGANGPIVLADLTASQF